MAKACIAFGMDSATEAWHHLLGDRQLVINYGNEFEGKYLHTWDDGERILFRCKECGGYFLYQTSEYHGRDDSYYHDFFPVTGPEEAESLNRRWNGWQIEDYFPDRYLIQDDNWAPHWKWANLRGEG